MVLDDVRSYAENRMIPSGKDTTIKLADMPFMRDELERITDCLYVYKTFGILNEERFIHSKDGNISKKTVEYIACGKTEIVEFCIEKIHSLKLKVGSYCLQSNSLFGPRNEILYAYRFAEGDSSILKQKMARDSLKAISRNPLNLLGLFMSLPVYYVMYTMGMGLTMGLKWRLNWNLLILAVSMMGL